MPTPGTPMPHGYTNATATDGTAVVKRYLGPDSHQRQAREELALRRLAGVLPVPVLVSSSPGTLLTRFVPGVPAQQAIADGRAAEVLHACGQLLASLQAIDPRVVFGSAADQPEPRVLVHNDFGPNNMVLPADPAAGPLLCDWEWVTIGSPYTDLAWAEFIVRSHHRDDLGALPALFEGYGARPAWALRQRAMLARAASHRSFVLRWHGPPGAAGWDERIGAIRGWRD